MHSDYDWNSWNPKLYLDMYFNHLGDDSFAAWRFLISAFKKIKAPVPILDFGSGPTIFSVIPMAPYATEIHMCEYLESNRNEVSDWLIGKPDAFDWSSCIKEVLILEGKKGTPMEVKERENLIKKKVTKVIECDASKTFPLANDVKYPVVVSTYCVDSATNSKEVWKSYMQNLMNLVEEDGLLLISALKNCKEYSVGNIKFPSANINELNLISIFIKNGIDENNFTVSTAGGVSERKGEGFQDLIFASVVVRHQN